MVAGDRSFRQCACLAVNIAQALELTDCLLCEFQGIDVVAMRETPFHGLIAQQPGR